MRITALAGGIGGARFLRGLLAHLEHRPTSAAGSRDRPRARQTGAIQTGARRTGGARYDVTVIGNTADDITLHGLRICPDLDTVMYTLGGGVHESQGWGRAGETFEVAHELAAYGADPDWFTLGDRDIATHLVRSRLLLAGYPLSQVTAALCARWQPGVTLLPMSDDSVETHVVVDDDTAEGGQRAIHFQEWWVRLHASVPARRIVAIGAEQSTPAPGVLDAIRDADVVLLPPSNPVVSIGTILSVPGIRDALRGTRAPVIGVSPIVGGAPVRGMADACMTALGLETSASAVAGLYADLLDGWLVDDSDAHCAGRPIPGSRASVVARPLLMHDVDAATEIAGAALDLAHHVGQR